MGDATGAQVCNFRHCYPYYFELTTVGGSRPKVMGEELTYALLHVPFEAPAYLGGWALQRGTLRLVHLYAGEAPPPVVPDNLLIMGGPMGVADLNRYPWMLDELRYMERAMANGARVIGICLGAQLIAHALGARVYRNPQKEIGWFDVSFTVHGRTRFPGLPERARVFHWHGDTFEIPTGALHLASSDASPNQAFVHGENILALQFHAEATTDSVEELLANCAEDLTPGPFVQERPEIRTFPEDRHRFKLLDILLQGMSRVPPRLIRECTR